MSFFRYSPFFLLGAASLAGAQNPAAPAAPDHVQHLDKFVVSAGHDPKTMFDLAQGTSVLAGEELHRLAQRTLGDTLNGMPGVSATSYGPGASRPVIRGLGGDRVRVLDNGVGTLDAASVSPDHNTAIEPLFASRIEVLRGPSTLLYGSSAVGGAVNVIANAIPDTRGTGQPAGAVELRAGGAARERAAVVSVGHGSGGWQARVNALQQRTGDLRIPGVARIDAEAPASQPEGILPGSAAETFSGSIGLTRFGAAGHTGAALQHLDTTYGVPTGEDISIHMRQTRLTLEGDVTRAFGVFRGAKARLAFGDYTHAEVAGGSIVNTRFDNRAWEGRLELPHQELGPLTGTIGFQSARSNFAAHGAEVVTPPTVTQSGALFGVEEIKLGSLATVQAGVRLEVQQIKLGEVDSSLPPLAGYAAYSNQAKTFAGPAGSLGLVFYPAKDWSVGAAVAYSERLPAAAELFAHGPHGGTNAYEIGTTGLPNERSVGFDLSVRRRAGFVTGSVGVFLHRFQDYIFEQELPLTAVPARANPDQLTPYQFVATDARFTGAEAELLFHLLENDHQRLHLELSGDSVRARQTATHEPLPRIPPVRLGARLNYEDGRWHATAEVRRTERQNRFAPSEGPTAGHTQLHASVSFLIPLPRLTCELFLRGRNLTNVAAREHASFLKEFAPQAGRGLLAGVRLTF